MLESQRTYLSSMEATSDSVLDWDHMTDLEDAQVLWYLQRLQGATLEEEEDEAVWEDLDSEDIPAVSVSPCLARATSTLPNSNGLGLSGLVAWAQYTSSLVYPVANRCRCHFV